MGSKSHLELSDYIKSVHEKLRVLSNEVGAEEAWGLHIAEKETLQKYASAMHTLATSHWVKNNGETEGLVKCRITWVVDKCNYYFKGGDEIKQAEKEFSLCLKHQLQSQREHDDVLAKSDKSKVSLLDVGSCFNPFSVYSLFEVTAIDLCPAVDSVLKCDFLKLDVLNRQEFSVLCNNHRQLLSIRASSFDVVVFSLFLEYLPSSDQRFDCCKKAYDILRPGGLLFILSPDSKHATANSQLLKSWRICLSSLGFNRIYYEKSKHLHFLTFRKAFVKDLPLRWFNMKGSNTVHKIVIPQDLKTKTIDEVESPKPFQRDDIADDFLLLPSEDLFST